MPSAINAFITDPVLLATQRLAAVRRHIFPENAGDEEDMSASSPCRQQERIEAPHFGVIRPGSNR
ncbi:MAG: hypothetical protein ACLR8Y_18155 [Alistipes indistinctus]